MMKNLPIQNGEILLAQEPFSEAMAKLKGLISAVDTDFNQHYVSTAQRFAELTQTMPYQKEDKVLLFSYQMETALAALTLARGRLLPQKAVVEDKNHRAPAWIYGLFVAAFLRGIERMQHDRLIALLDNHGKIIDYWSPLWCPTLTHYSHYLIQWKSDITEPAAKPLSYPVSINAVACRSLLVPRLIPDESLAWLQADADLNAEWWDCLCDHTVGNNEIAQLLEQAAEKLERVKRPQAVSANAETKPTDPPVSAAETNPANLAAATPVVAAKPVSVTQQFIDWLTEQLTLEAMQPYIFRVELGILVMREAIEQFIALNKLTEKDLIDLLLAENKIVKYKEHVFQRYATKNWVNPESFEGIVLNLNGLSAALLQLPLQDNCQPDVI